VKGKRKIKKINKSIGRHNMAVDLESQELLIYKSRIKVPYTWSVGEVGSRFLTELKDNKKIWGTKCPLCDIVFVPPKKTCTYCFVPIHEWVQVKDEGVLETFTVIRYETDLIPRKTPQIIGIVVLDGADTGLVHFIGDVPPDKLAAGMRVKAVFEEDRKGHILDIKHFKPIS
jgi:uncharacterized OB-fold protein